MKKNKFFKQLSFMIAVYNLLKIKPWNTPKCLKKLLNKNIYQV